MTRIRAARVSATAAWIAMACVAFPCAVQANLFKDRNQPVLGLSTGADAKFTRSTRTTSRTRPAIPSTKPAAKGISPRVVSPVIVAKSTAAGQTGYVHYFQIKLPDGTLEIQVGIELPDQRIAWSFPGLGVTISAFTEDGVVAAGGSSYEVWHLYGIRPFPDDAAMSALHRELPGRIDPWVKAAMPYCGIDGLDSHCMSCLGFVLRALYPGRGSGYPDLPGDFWRAGNLGRYSTNDLLLYLTGMLDLPTREARLRRIRQLTLPDELRADLKELVYSMGATESSMSVNAGAPAGATPKRPVARQPSRVGNRPAQRKRL